VALAEVLPSNDSTRRKVLEVPANPCYLQTYNAPVIRYVYVQKSSRYVKSVATTRSVLLSAFLEVIFEEV
jgi:hypothetical protein